MIQPSFSRAAIGVCFAVAIMSGCSSTQNADEAGATGAGAGAYGSDPNSVQSGAAGVGGVDSEALDGGGYGGYGAYGSDGSLLGPQNQIYYFGFDTSELTMADRSRLDQTAAALRNKKGLVRLEGHADERGTREYNLALGERRAKAIANYLAIQGVSSSQIETISYGEEKPDAFGHSESAWAKNRRVQLIYLN